MNDSFGLMLLSASNTTHAPFAAYVTPFSTYLIGLCITLQRVPARLHTPAARGRQSLRGGRIAPDRAQHHRIVPKGPFSWLSGRMGSRMGRPNLAQPESTQAVTGFGTCARRF